VRQHAFDMLAALDTLQIPFCQLATYSTGGIIAARMLLKQRSVLGASMNLEVRRRFFFGAWFGGLARSEVAI